MRNDSAILCIETATQNCSVAIFKNDELISLRELESQEYVHSEKLATFISQVLIESSIQPHQLSGVVVSSGPGSYTGLRIGVASAKGLCLGAGIPLISIPNLFQLAHAAAKIDQSFDFYIPMIDARRMEVYTSTFNAKLEVIDDTQAKIIDNSSFMGLKGKRIAIFGDGAEKCKEALSHLDITLIKVKCSARNMGQIALNKLEKKDFEDLAYYEPFYLKDFIAGAPKKIF